MDFYQRKFPGSHVLTKSNHRLPSRVQFGDKMWNFFSKDRTILGITTHYVDILRLLCRESTRKATKDAKNLTCPCQRC